MIYEKNQTKIDELKKTNFSIGHPDIPIATPEEMDRIKDQFEYWDREKRGEEQPPDKPGEYAETMQDMDPQYQEENFRNNRTGPLVLNEFEQYYTPDSDQPKIRRIDKDSPNYHVYKNKKGGGNFNHWKFRRVHDKVFNQDRDRTKPSEFV